MMVKYRVHEVAKDLGVPSKDVIDLLAKHFKDPKKHMTALTEEELNVVFEHFTKKSQVKNFDEYFASGAKREETPKAEELEEKKESAQTKPAAKQQGRPQQNRPQNGGTRKQGQHQAKGQQSQGQNNRQESRSAQQQNRSQNGAKQQGNVSQQPVTTSTASGKTLRHVDTRTSNVNLDKYNEHYEEIAPNTPVTKNTQKKQKLNQRSAQRGKPQYAKRESEAEKLRRLAL